MPDNAPSVKLPDWWFAHAALSLDPTHGDGPSYEAGARDMLAILTAHPEWLNATTAP